MPLTTGIRLGPYEILAPIGAGGMGEVYRARDTRLDRMVAIKVLPSYLAADPQLRDRFDREARAISSLQHPHICALFDVGEAPNPSAPAAGPIQFLVLEYLEGETVADRLTRTGALPTADALKIGAEICDALDRAHRSHIVHRDLKPANVMLTKGGAKLLDFGLAKAATPVVSTSGLSMVPTTPPELTAQGTILGTFQYMAPEQIEGLEADARTDIFAFGALLFEMLTGRTAFEGKTRASLLGAILKDDPPRVSALKPGLPRAIDRIVGICLAKDPDDRYQSARDLLRDLKDAAKAEPIEVPAAPAASHRPYFWSRFLAIAGGLALIAALAVVAIGRLGPAGAGDVAAEPIRFSISAPDGATFLTPGGGGTGAASQMAVSPDGKFIVFVANSSNTFQLWVRPLGGVEPRLLAGTEDASFPFWSPDSRFIGFFAEGKLKKVALEGGAPLVLCAVITGRGGTWNRDNVILFAPSTTGPLQRVSAAGGIPVAASALDTQYGETAHRFPFFLPDGRHFLFTATVGTCCPAAKSSRVEVGALDSTDVTEILSGLETTAAYASGHLFFNRDGVLMARPFDANTMHLTGEPFPVAETVAWEGSRYASFSVSETGVLVHAAGNGLSLTHLTWMDRTGKNLATVGDVSDIRAISLSPDEHRIAVALIGGTPPNRDIWIVDAERKTSSRFTFDPADDNAPVWAPDGSALVFGGNRSGSQSLMRQPLSGATNEETLLDNAGKPGALTLPSDWSSDGRYILYTSSLTGNQTSLDLWILPLFGDRKPMPFAQTAATENNGTFSPDGRWIAYTSNESGAAQIFVRPFPPAAGKWQISQGGGTQAAWSRDQRELFFMTPDGRMMVSTVRTSGTFEFSAPSVLFPMATPLISGVINYRQYAPSKDGKRILVNALAQRSATTPLTVVLNWLSTKK